MNHTELLKKNKLSILLVSIMTLTMMKSHADPIDILPDNSASEHLFSRGQSTNSLSSFWSSDSESESEKAHAQIFPEHQVLAHSFSQSQSLESLSSLWSSDSESSQEYIHPNDTVVEPSLARSLNVDSHSNFRIDDTGNNQEHVILDTPIIESNHDIILNQQRVHELFYLKSYLQKDEPISRSFNAYDSYILINHPSSALKVEDVNVNIQNTTIQNDVGHGITIVKKNSAADEYLLPEATIEHSKIIVGDKYGITNHRSHITIDNTTIAAGKKNGDMPSTIGLFIESGEQEEDDKTTLTEVLNSKINSAGNGINIQGGITRIRNSIINASDKYGVMIFGGDLSIAEGSKISAKNDATGLFISHGENGTYADNNIILDNAIINTTNNSAITIAGSQEFINPNNRVNLTLQNNTQIMAGNGNILQAWNNYIVKLNIHNSHLTGGFLSEQESNVNINLGRNASFSGQTKNINLLFLDKSALWNMTASSDMKYMYNAGNIILSKAKSISRDLLIRQDYVSRDGRITFNPRVVDNHVLTDKLIIQGHSSGTTHVAINNIGSISSAALNGLELVRVDGLSEGIFKQSGRMVAGAYDYSLARGLGSKRGNWYLTNQHSSSGSTKQQIQRPEAASYIANLSAANALFNTTLNDRLGETQFTDARTGEKKVTSLWLRQVGNHNNWRDSNSQLKTQSNSYITQLGGDIMKWSTNDHNRGHLGLMVGYGKNHSHSYSSLTNYHSKGSINGYSVGTYMTWFTKKTDKSGLYVDGWIQYNWFNNHVRGQELATERYKSKGINASIETGYTAKVKTFTKKQGAVDEWFIQPQVQITKTGVKAKKHKEANGTRITSNGEGNIQSRLGIRTYLKGHHAMDKNKNREFEPFVEANWLHNTRSFSATMNGDRVTQAGTRNIGEVKVGIAGKINSKVNLWGNVGVQVADKGYNNTSAMVGIKYSF